MATTINAGTATSGAAISADTTGILQLQSGSTPTTAVTVDTSQNVGIGTTSPASKLDVKAGSGSVISRSTSGVNFKAFYDDGRTTYTSVNYDGISTSGAQDFYLASGQGLYFRVNSNSSVYEQLKILSSGSMIVGSASTENGQNSISFSNATDTASYGKAMLFNTQYNSTRNAIVFQYNSGTVGTIVTGTSSTAYNTSSDYRLKEDVKPMTNALATVSALKPVTYKWKIDGSDGQGFIAHELQEVVPDAVSGEKDAVNEDGSIKPQGIDTSFLVATLTAAIQELNAKVEAQALEIQAFKGVA